MWVGIIKCAVKSSLIRNFQTIIYATNAMRGIKRERERVMISCELQDLEDLMGKAGVLLTGNAYDKAQDYLQDSCSCATYNYLLGYKRGRE